MNNISQLVITLDVLLKLQTGQTLTHRERNQLAGAAEQVLAALKDDFHMREFLGRGPLASKDEIPF